MRRHHLFLSKAFSIFIDPVLSAVRGAHAARVWCSAARRTRIGGSKGSGEPPEPARGLRALPGPRRIQSAHLSRNYFILALLLVTAAHAHVAGLSQLSIQAHDRYAEVTLRLSPNDTDNDGQISPGELAAGQALLVRLSPEWFRVTCSGRALALRPDPAIETENNTLIWRARIEAPPKENWQLELLALPHLSPGHRELVTVTKGDAVVAEALLSADNPALTLTWQPENPAQPSQANSTIFADFLKLGVEHIATGYDHLLYLAGLILACRRLGGMVAMITSFTVAHSITLALATTGLVTLPSEIVEPTIAASIVFVGLQNLWAGPREVRGRWIVAFIFGLIHGFGFASLLRDAGIGSGNGASILVPLLSFNLGVELGQLAIVALLLPLLLWLRRARAFETFAQPLASAAVLAMGSFWLIQRVWF